MAGASTNSRVVANDGGGDSSDGINELLTPVSTLDEPVGETIMRDVRAVGAKLRAVLMPLDRSVSSVYTVASFMMLLPCHYLCNDAISLALLYHVTCNISHTPFLTLYKRSLFSKQPFGYVNVLQEEDVNPSIHQQNVLNQLRDWDLWGPLLICLSLAIILSAKAPTTQTSHVFTTVFIVMWVGATVVTINAQLLGASMSIFQSVCVLGYCVFPLTVSAFLIAILRKTWFGIFYLDLIWLALGLLWSTRVSSIFVGQFVKRERRLLALYPVFFFYLLLGWLILLF